MTHDKKIEQALKYLYNQGYGKGSNYTTMTIASLMVEYAEQQVKNLSLSAVSVNEVAVCSARKSYQSCDLHHDNEHGCEECGNYEQTER